MREYPALQVDDAYAQVERADGRAPLVYRFPAGPGLVLDMRGYDFPVPFGQASAEPDVVQVILPDGAKYAGRFRPSEGRQVLDAATLKPIGPSPAFGGFLSGQTVVLAIGNGRVESSRFTLEVLWVAMATVE